MWILLLNSLLLAAWLTGCQAVDQPSVQLGDTTIIGNSLQPSNLEFFGGRGSPILAPPIPHPLTFRYSFCRASSQRSPLDSSEAEVFTLSPAVIRCS